MDDQNLPAIRQLFETLDARRHLPGYRLEGRLAPFFELFLLKILGDRFADTALHPVVIPEFPLRIGTLYGPDKSTWPKPRHTRPPGVNQSYNVDYVVYSADLDMVFLVELKTDMAYRSDEQDAYLRCARKIPFGRFVNATTELAKASGAKPKYVHLLHLLAQLDLVNLLEDTALYGLSFPKARSGWTAAIDGLRFNLDGKLADTKIVYIQPRDKKNRPKPQTFTITFPDVAQSIRDSGEIGWLFAHYLDRWANECPGSRDPRTSRSAP